MLIFCFKPNGSIRVIAEFDKDTVDAGLRKMNNNTKIPLCGNINKCQPAQKHIKMLTHIAAFSPKKGKNRLISL